MDLQTLLEKYRPLLKQHRVPLVFGLIGLIFFSYGLIGLIGSSRSSSNISFEEENQTSESTKSAQIVVDVEGAVIKPGVYKLPFESRVSNALIAASGLSLEANRDWVAKNINMAAKLNDGAKIYIPSIKEKTIANTSSTNLRQADLGGGRSETGGLVNINSATWQELDALPGIGSVTAEKIINSRPYGSINELLNKKVVTQKVFEQIKEKITIY